jgi:predicted phosphodiesterase
MSARDSIRLEAQTPAAMPRRVAALYDIHSNLPALDAVLHDVRQARADEIVVGGDLLPGPMPRQCLQRLRALEIPVRWLRGNGDREALTLAAGGESSVPEQHRASVRWSGEQLTADEFQFVASWPPTQRLDIDGLGEVLFCHATPQNDTDIFTIATPVDRLLPLFRGLTVAAVICGHTHMPFDRRVGALRVINAGSVGMPWGQPGADWLLIGPGFELQHTAYPLETAANRIRASGYPMAEAFAAEYVLNPPSAQKMIERYRAVEVR